MGAAPAAVAGSAVHHIGSVADIAPAVTAANNAFGKITAVIIDTGALAGTALAACTDAGAITVALTAAHMALMTSAAGIAGFIFFNDRTAFVIAGKGQIIPAVIADIIIGIGINRGHIYGICLAGRTIHNQKQRRNRTQADAQPFHNFSVVGEVDEG